MRKQFNGAATEVARMVLCPSCKRPVKGRDTHICGKVYSLSAMRGRSETKRSGV
jgi:hypothetical protein